MPQSLWEAWHPDRAGHLTPAQSHGQIKAGEGSQGRAAGRNGAQGAPMASPHLLCARPLKGRQVGSARPNPVSDKVEGPSSLARDKQGEKTTNKGTEAGENSACSQSTRLRGKGDKHKVRAGPGARAPRCGQEEGFGATEGPQGEAGCTRIWPPVCPEGKDSWGGASFYPPGTGLGGASKSFSGGSRTGALWPEGSCLDEKRTRH